MRAYHGPETEVFQFLSRVVIASPVTIETDIIELNQPGRSTKVVVSGNEI